MKLNKLHLLLLLVTLLVFSNFGTSIMEGMQNRKGETYYKDILKRVDELTSQFGGKKPSKHYVKHASQQAHQAQHAKQIHLEKRHHSQAHKTHSHHSQAHKTHSHHDFVNKHEIPEGDEDLYILKSKIVPPVCPKCPDVSVCPKSKGGGGKCAPCPPCGRCPVAPFECKKVPTYASSTSDYLPNFFNGSMMGGSTTNGDGLPRPILNDFSKFS